MIQVDRLCVQKGHDKVDSPDLLYDHLAALTSCQHLASALAKEGS